MPVGIVCFSVQGLIFLMYHVLKVCSHHKAYYILSLVTAYSVIHMTPFWSKVAMLCAWLH